MTGVVLRTMQTSASTDRVKEGAQGPPGWGRHGAAGAAQKPQAMAQGAERDKPEGGRWAVG